MNAMLDGLDRLAAIRATRRAFGRRSGGYYYTDVFYERARPLYSLKRVSRGGGLKITSGPPPPPPRRRARETQ